MRILMWGTIFVFVGVVGCNADPGADGPTPAAPAPDPGSAQPAAPAVEGAEAAPAGDLAAAADGNGRGGDAGEACGQMIVSAYKGAKFAAAEVARSRDEASARAQALLAKVTAGADFAALAKAESEAPSSAPRGGVMGTYAREDWPDIHRALEAPLFALAVGEVAGTPVETAYGFVVLKRCPVEKAHGRHILIRYQGAKRAEPEVTRSREEAKKAAEAVLAELVAGKGFAELARERSEDGSAERGGDVGSPGRGRLALPFERALFSLQPGERSQVVETEFGFHIIERLPDL